MARNITEHIKECGDLGLMNTGGVPNTVDFFAVHNIANLSTALNSCCADHTVPYGTVGVADDCYIYCNVTAPATIDSVGKCVTQAVGGSYISMSGTKQNATSAAVTWDAKKSGLMGYLVLALGVSSVAWGLL